jgi:hypothetical protein
MHYQVDIIESEAGWGARVDATLTFDTENEAAQFVQKFNSKNNSKTVPSWYMYATAPRAAQ